MGLEKVQELLTMEIYPIIILVIISEKNGKKFRWVLLPRRNQRLKPPSFQLWYIPRVAPPFGAMVQGSSVTGQVCRVLHI